MNTTKSIQANLERVRDRINEAAISAGRSPEEVRLVTVTKGKSMDQIAEVIAAGATDLGENYAEQGQAKIMAASDYSGVQWHMIGHIQSRKARIVAEHFNYVHSLDSLKLGRRLDRFSSDSKNVLPVLLEVNVSGEATKFGWHAHNEANWNQLLPDFTEIAELQNLEVHGLMTIAPMVSDADESRPFFQRLRKLSKFLAEQLPGFSWDELSMGMSADFEQAIMEGATLVRIGSAILGPRANNK